ncbi:VanZ family protein [Microbacterium mcarthurae (nom. nud.)]|uniref:VanZ family protein n=1 Tax=Microbacterium mcarthurae TaxID=3035918 RepID=A0ABW9GD02_9MICO
MLVAASASYTFGLWWITLRPAPYGPETASVLESLLRALEAWPPTAWVTFELVEFGANIALFAPFGLLVLAWGGRPWLGVLGGLALSVVIELSQWALLPSRVADTRDLLANTIGAAVGVVAAMAVARARRLHSERIARAIESS